MSDLLIVVLAVAALAILLVAIDRALKRRDERWESDDWRRDTPTARVGTPLLEIQSLLEPGVRNRLEEERRVQREERDAGAPPDEGGEPREPC